MTPEASETTEANDDAERAACAKAGKPGHLMCGTCPECRRPRFECGHVLILEARA